MTLAVKQECTEFLAHVVKCTLARLVETLIQGSKNTKPMAAEGNMTIKSAIVKHFTDLDHVIDWDQAQILTPERHW